MKNKHRFLLFLFSCLMVTSVWAKKMSVVQVNCKFPDAPKTEMYLCAIKDGFLHPIASSMVAENGNCAFAFFPEKEGFYFIGTKFGSRINGEYVFYFKSGDNLQFQINAQGWNLVGENSPENQELEKWHQLIEPLEKMAVDSNDPKKNTSFDIFFPQLEATLPQTKAFRPKTPNQKFNTEFEFYKQYDLLAVALIFTHIPSHKYPSSTDFTQYYKDISIQKLTSSPYLLNYPGYINLIRWSYINAIERNTSLTKEERSKKHSSVDQDILHDINIITNELVKGELVLFNASQCKTYNQIMKFKNEYEKYFVTDSQKARFKKLLANLDDNSRGNDAVDFKLLDIDGKEVSLSDFKDKVVYLDFWATWCGPCLKEIPHMIKLEKEYKDNPNIVFMAVSVDQEKDKQKWVDMVIKKEMKGVHLFAGKETDNISTSYHIQGIPRFVLIGKGGKIINSQAPRPSSTMIRTLLEEALAE